MTLKNALHVCIVSSIKYSDAKECALCICSFIYKALCQELVRFCTGPQWMRAKYHHHSSLADSVFMLVWHMRVVSFHNITKMSARDTRGSGRNVILT